MRRKTRAKVKKGFAIAGIIIAIILAICAIIFAINKTKKEKKSYDDGIVCKNYFTEISIDLSTKKVKRDKFATTLQEEFGISKEQEEFAFTSVQEMKNLLSNSVFDISVNDQVLKVKNKYQTKNLIVEADDIEEKVKGEEIIKLQDNVYILNFYSEKLTKEMYDFYKNKKYIKNIYLDEVYIDKPLNDISQTMYGGTEVELNGFHSLGATTMGIDNYQNVIYENGNPSDIVIATIGYGIDIQNEIFNGRIDNNYYNFILNNKEIKETIAQGSRIGEVLVDSTTSNVKIMPLVTVTEEGYTSLSSIIKAISHSIKKANVICYEQINHKHDVIDLMLENAFNKNVPVCAVSSNEKENYPAEQGKTIATSSVNRELNLAEYSSQGSFIDFAAPSTDIEEIFNSNATVSRWSGPQYSNAQIAAIISLIKTYNKDASVLDVYKFLMNFSVDLGDAGKDKSYGFGMPNFKGITISDIDKENPQFGEIVFDNEIWELLKQIKVTATDNIRIFAWAITKNEDVPQDTEWKNLEELTPTLDVTGDIAENGTYTIWVRDSAGNTINSKIEINKIDTEGPKIEYEINKDFISQGYVTINVTAEDLASGLSDSPFSWDNRTWSVENATKIIKENGRYKVYAVDNLGNTSEIEILVDCFPQEGIYELAEGNLITSMAVSADWTENLNNKVEIEINKDMVITGWQITTNTTVPTNFVPVATEIVHDTLTADGNNQEYNYDMPNNLQMNTTNTNTSTTNSVNQNNLFNNNTSQNSINQNTISTQNTIQNQNTTNSPQSNDRVTSAQNQHVQRIINPEQVKITTALEADKIYYLWVKDENGNIKGQVFQIHKAPI